MAKDKSASKPKENFKPYNPGGVPDVMPFPDLARVATTRGEETAVPKLNEDKQSWILDVGVRGLDLASLNGSAATTVYDKVKMDALEAKAFQHRVRPQDKAEEAQLSKLIAAWKEKNPAKKGKTNNQAGGKDEDDDNGDAEDADGRTSLLRGYTKAGWRLAIQKVISNRRTDTKRKSKPTAETDDSVPQVPAITLSKLFGLAAYSGRDKFRDDRHDEIGAYAKTLPGSSNAGAKFRKAEGILWEKEDHASWAAAAAANDEDVDWVERQKMVASGFKHMVDTLHTSGKFRPFMATMAMGWLNVDGRVHLEWQVVISLIRAYHLQFASSRAEAVPKGIDVSETFKKTYPPLAQEFLDSIHDWAKKPLKDYMATLEDSAKGAVAVFPLTVAATDNVTGKELTEILTSFFAESYEAAFGSREIPWVTIANEPGVYYDTTKFLFRFTSDGLAHLTLSQRSDMATALASDAGAGSSGFFRKVLPPPPPPPSPPRSPSPPPAEEREREAARLRREAEEREREGREREEREAEEHEREEHEREKREEREREAARLRREVEEREQEEHEGREREKREEREREEREREKREAARLRREAEEREREEHEGRKREKREEREREEREREKREEREHEEREREVERLRCEAEEHEAEGSHAEEEEEEEVSLAPKKRGRKRKAELELGPEDTGAAGCPSRARKTPQEAKLDREAKIKAAVRGTGKPRYEYVEKSPVKRARGSTKRYEICRLLIYTTELKIDFTELELRRNSSSWTELNRL
ncbi:hypothetical protein B0H11DRAFT_1909002 [Mycena galericulata]|nr:hypothetical protein B0H11DRAFT_1909002 [Mycena galericulata]